MSASVDESVGDIADWISNDIDDLELISHLAETRKRKESSISSCDFLITIQESFYNTYLIIIIQLAIIYLVQYRKN